MVASVDYACATFLSYLLGLYQVNFVFDFVKANDGSHLTYLAHVIFWLMIVLMVFGGLINVFRSQLLAREAHHPVGR